MNEHSHQVAAAISLPLAAAAAFAAVGISAPAVHSISSGALPEFTVAAAAPASALDDDVHVDATYEAADLQPALYGTARTGVAIALPGRVHDGGAAPTLTVPGVDPSVPWWLSRAASTRRAKRTRRFGQGRP